MDARNKTDRRNRKSVTQTWRAVSTQSDRSEGNHFVAFILENRRVYSLL